MKKGTKRLKGEKRQEEVRRQCSWKQSICPPRFQSPVVKDTKKGARKCHKGTKQPIRQLREQLYRTMT